MIKFLLKLIAWVHKYSVPMLFIINVFLIFCVYSDWYAKYYEHLDNLLSISVIPCLVFIYEGYIRRKCMWFKLASFGLLLSSSLNFFDSMFHFDGYIFFVMAFISIIILFAMFYYLLKEFDHDFRDEPSNK